MTNLQQLLKKGTPIRESEILANLPADELPKWENFMRGKTILKLEGGDHGIYTWDYAEFLRLNPSL
jgi:hypothetical protein